MKLKQNIVIYIENKKNKTKHNYETQADTGYVEVICKCFFLRGSEILQFNILVLELFWIRT